MKNKKNKQIEIVNYNPMWPQIFKKEAISIKESLGDNFLAIYHFGSTAIPGLSAKAKIDIISVVKKNSRINILGLENLGFENRGEIIKSGRYFSKLSPKVHLHVFEKDNPLIEQNLKFRDWLRTHSNDCTAYVKLKNKLATIHDDGNSYYLAKTKFISNILENINQININNQSKFLAVRKLNLPISQYAITGSGPLGIRNLKRIGDIDIIVTNDLWKDLLLEYGMVDINGVKKIVMTDNIIEIFYEDSFSMWPKEKDEQGVTECIAQSEIIDGLPFVPLKYILYYKYKMKREKDLDDIKIIESLISFSNENIK